MRSFVSFPSTLPRCLLNATLSVATAVSLTVSTAVTFSIATAVDLSGASQVLSGHAYRCVITPLVHASWLFPALYHVPAQHYLAFAS